jgi:hypothetical protein
MQEDIEVIKTMADTDQEKALSVEFDKSYHTYLSLFVFLEEDDLPQLDEKAV